MRAFRSTETFKAGDQEFTLAIDIEIIDALEDEFDTGFDQIFQESIGKGRIGRTARLLRGLLARHHPDLELDEIGGLATDHGIEIGEAIKRLIEKAIPEEVKDINPPKAHRGTGVSSSSRGARQTSRQSSSGSRRREPCS